MAAGHLHRHLDLHKVQGVFLRGTPLILAHFLGIDRLKLVGSYIFYKATPNIFGMNMAGHQKDYFLVLAALHGMGWVFWGYTHITPIFGAHVQLVHIISIS